MGIKAWGVVLFFMSMLVYTIYILGVFIPAINADPSNTNLILNAFWWALGCGIGATIGVILAKRR